jgi:hypothetical protein
MALQEQALLSAAQQRRQLFFKEEEKARQERFRAFRVKDLRARSFIEKSFSLQRRVRG